MVKYFISHPFHLVKQAVIEFIEFLHFFKGSVFVFGKAAKTVNLGGHFLVSITDALVLYAEVLVLAAEALYIVFKSLDLVKGEG